MLTQKFEFESMVDYLLPTRALNEQIQTKLPLRLRGRNDMLTSKYLMLPAIEFFKDRLNYSPKTHKVVSWGSTVEDHYAFARAITYRTRNCSYEDRCHEA
ncbi:hypothetical protein PMIN06_006402 [Paraphaeosphaeria minitans]